ncbi:MAG: 16S rRNA (cytidine(1402)-2'-O)-methyltransferase [Pseudomonadota bacterium]|nr:16S rRNA (cytidine(1402)-2'-O)-methyltransferase [Gammaproteobacteria bacterium]MBU1558515.1 16S rRNA (cytidine(1402)-2'-O)-methyltransferase [Gammaproteobacteria bacterium]MBU1629412.1 16S rRNA (cytidine(1402)-2'-O)-methyltransferase [Gammaproteobacteria bacterium]MBU1926490.1 16S rRNA (cytidine(1402)-2'-O)-methyltransferase [Gammaproteobacteria bacterium]MBU2546008.1 16S rRNA (cytidine(1402)-2'-O)-methyltransferase [Gammaproteobacteria bacterium]
MINPATLYVVATPIGNLDDITFRALHVLKSVDWIAAEDTRHSAHLLEHYQIKTSMVSFHEHNEEMQQRKVLGALSNQQSVALISDAGTPLVSDPGYHLVRAAVQEGFSVVPIPGACAAIVALSAAGLPSDRFIFEGFLPAKQHARVQRLEAIREELRTLIFYESPHRILALLQDMLQVLGEERRVVIARELTKLYETIHSDRLVDVLAWMTAHHEQQCGEFVVLVEGYEEGKKIAAEDERILKTLLKELPLKQAVRLAAVLTNKPKNALYELALKL